MEKRFWVYILASAPYGTLYTGMTSHLPQRTTQHKDKAADGFTKKYDVDRLVYFEEHTNAESAIKREKQIKEWQRQWKINLIEKDNPRWDDLYEAICR